MMNGKPLKAMSPEESYADLKKGIERLSKEKLVLRVLSDHKTIGHLESRSDKDHWRAVGKVEAARREVRHLKKAIALMATMSINLKEVGLCEMIDWENHEP